MPPTVAFSRSVLRNDFDKSGKGRGLKLEVDAVLYGEQDSRTKFVGSGTIYGTDVSDSDEF